MVKHCASSLLFHCFGHGSHQWPRLEFLFLNVPPHLSHVPYPSQSVYTWRFAIACELTLPRGLKQLLSSVRLYQTNLPEIPLSFTRHCVNTSSLSLKNSQPRTTWIYTSSQGGTCIWGNMSMNLCWLPYLRTSFFPGPVQNVASSSNTHLRIYFSLEHFREYSIFKS